MKQEQYLKILAIESSCDETAAAVIGSQSDKPVILSNVVSSQVNLHAKTGGVVPEVASRAHLEAIVPVIEESLSKAETVISEITHLAVTSGPGLIGSLLVGFNSAKSIAYALKLPIVPVNHIEGHIYSALVQNTGEQIKFPLLALTVSGGHTSLTLVHNHGHYENIGATIDDAAGEAFDKVAKLLDLSYPGGPAVSRIASDFRLNGHRTGLELPMPLARDNSCNFSFSGLKTSVLYALQKAEKQYAPDDRKIQDFRSELACVFEETAVAHLIDKTIKALHKTGARTVLLAGGVSANKYLREQLQNMLDSMGVQLLLPPIELCGDNAAMVGIAAYYHILRKDIKTWKEIQVDSNLLL